MKNNFKKLILEELKYLLKEAFTDSTGRVDVAYILNLSQHKTLESTVENSGFLVKGKLKNALSEADIRLKNYIQEYNTKKITKVDLDNKITQEINQIQSNNEGDSFEDVRKFKKEAIIFLNYLRSIVSKLPEIKDAPDQPSPQPTPKPQPSPQPTPQQPTEDQKSNLGSYNNPFLNKDQYEEWLKENNSMIQNAKYDIGFWFFDPSKAYSENNVNTYYLCSVYYKKYKKSFTNPSCLSVDATDDKYKLAKKSYMLYRKNLGEHWINRNKNIHSKNLFEKLINKRIK